MQMKRLLTILFVLIGGLITAQSSTIKGQLNDDQGLAVEFANIVLYNSADSTINKVEVTDDNGNFNIAGIADGDYYLTASFVGLSEITKSISLQVGQNLDLGVLVLYPSSVELAEATVTASRVMVEVKPDRTVFNVEGTINSVGQDAISLLRKAPGVTVDNNDNINVLGRAGVLLYVDGKRLPLAGDELTGYLQSLPAEQIDRIDIISNPGAKYEAEGNAGIIDIRLKRDKSLGANGQVSSTVSRSRYFAGNLNLNGNYRNKKTNIFGNGGIGKGRAFTDMEFFSMQNNLVLDETMDIIRDYQNYNYRVGVDLFANDKSTFGILVGGRKGDPSFTSENRIKISPQSAPTSIDSILVAGTTSEGKRKQNTFNVNYRFDNRKGNVLNIDLDYGKFSNETQRQQPNLYYDATETNVLSEVRSDYDTPTQIDIYTAKLDYEDDIFGGRLGIGAKYSKVISDNTFLVFDVVGNNSEQDNNRSNIFEYDESVLAGYISYSGKLSDKWNFSAGLRAEQTDATGDLQAFLPDLEEPPVILEYWSYFPSAGLTYQASRFHMFNLNYGRRINRPDYNVLNPFNNRVSELSFQKGNPFLRPEIVNNIELGYTYQYKYNFKLAYSRTTDQITRLIGPDDEDPRAGFITWENLAEQKIFSFSASAPITITNKWSSYFNLSASYLDNQADYGEGAIVDVQAFTYSIYQQQSFDLPGNFKGEVSGYFAGPGVWGGVFKYETSWSLNLGLSKKFFLDRMNVKLSANDIFDQSGWSGKSIFNGLESTGMGKWDSRKVALSISYQFGNQAVKNARRRAIGLEDEAGRVSGDQ